MTIHNLDKIFKPSSVVIIGAIPSSRGPGISVDEVLIEGIMAGLKEIKLQEH